MSLNAEALIRLALEAGREILKIYRTGFSVSEKADKTLLTEADKAAEAIIEAGLAALDPNLPVVAEEAVAAGRLPRHAARFALVDPLDGTREFVDRKDEFTVNIAIVEHGRPVMGVIYAPALGRIFVAENPSSAWQARTAPDWPVTSARSPLRIRAAPSTGLIAIASRSHGSPAMKDWLADYPVSKSVGAGSALKFGLLAAGEADLYPRLGTTMEWDTAAGHVIVEAAGGRLLTLEGERLCYGKRERGYQNPHFAVFGDVTPRRLVSRI